MTDGGLWGQWGHALLSGWPTGASGSLLLLLLLSILSLLFLLLLLLLLLVTIIIVAVVKSSPTSVRSQLPEPRVGPAAGAPREPGTGVCEQKQSFYVRLRPAVIEQKLLSSPRFGAKCVLCSGGVFSSQTLGESLVYHYYVFFKSGESGSTNCGDP